MEEIIKILQKRCYEFGGGCYNCTLRPRTTEATKCILGELKEIK